MFLLASESSWKRIRIQNPDRNVARGYLECQDDVLRPSSEIGAIVIIGCVVCDWIYNYGLSVNGRKNGTSLLTERTVSIQFDEQYQSR
jgi:hypothetical protein